MPKAGPALWWRRVLEVGLDLVSTLHSALRVVPFEVAGAPRWAEEKSPWVLLSLNTTTTTCPRTSPTPTPTPVLAATPF